jgi:hypothetical protein
VSAEQHTVRCIDCGFLSKRARWRGEFREHQGYHEAEGYDRENPRDKFTFVPGESNAQHPGEFGCYRGAANFPEEITQTAMTDGVGRDEAAKRVLVRARVCAKWIQYEPGLPPAETFREYRLQTVEADRQAFDLRLASFERRFNRRLTLTAIAFAVAIGLVQLWAAGMSMVPESMGSWFGRWVVCVTHAVARWFDWH